MADDPLAPIQAGDDVRKILSASRQNALADAARIVRGSLPVRWGRNRKHRAAPPEIAFELKDALTPGGNATAHPLTWDGSVWTPDTAAASEFEVYDVLGIFRGRAKDAYTTPHNQGSRGIARRFSPRGEYRIVQMTPHALMIRGKLTDDLETTDGTFTIDGVVVMQPTGSLIVDTDPAEPITVHNIFSWEGDDDGEIIAVWNENTGQWEAIQVECPA